MRVSEVAEQLSVDLSVASRQVAALALAGYVSASPTPTTAAPRACGRRSSARASSPTRTGAWSTAASALAGWSEEDIAALAERLERLREDFARGGLDPDPPGARRMSATAAAPAPARPEPA